MVFYLIGAVSLQACGALEIFKTGESVCDPAVVDTSSRAMSVSLIQSGLSFMWKTSFAFLSQLGEENIIIIVYIHTLS